jgi:hypothetical protein
MKTYSFSVEADYTNTGKDFIDSLLNEIDSEKKQLELTYRINRETTKLHKQILMDLVDEINATLQHVGLKFDRISQYSHSNEYQSHMAICTYQTGYSTIILITANNNEPFKDSKYVTYTGGYDLKIGNYGSTKYEIGMMRDVTHRFKTINEALNFMRDHLKKHLSLRS